MEQSRGSGWQRPTTPGGALVPLGHDRLRRQDTGLRGPVEPARRRATGQDSGRSWLSGDNGLQAGGPNAGSRPALIELMSPVPTAAEGHVGQLVCRLPGSTLAMDAGLSTAPAQAQDVLPGPSQG